jgi:hypothetical protein
MKLEMLVKDHVIKVLSACKTKSEAASILGITGRTLRNYLNRWEMGFEDQRRIDHHIEESESYRSITAEERDAFENMDRY